ncbi:hypothetical protein C4E44_01635 [Pseudomonas sp. MWU12-2312b]|nr:hypothetical protein C4E44_01635 [Pseudomonas sp. MWU12-2312b]
MKRVVISPSFIPTVLFLCHPLVTTPNASLLHVTVIIHFNFLVMLMHYFFFFLFAMLAHRNLFTCPALNIFRRPIRMPIIIKMFVTIWAGFLVVALRSIGNAHKFPSMKACRTLGLNG